MKKKDKIVGAIFLVETFVAIFTSSMAPALAQNPTTTTVGQYQVFEETFSFNTAGMANPWEDLTITVTFTSPSSQRTTVSGFYYAPNSFKVRFAPAELGRWRWAAILKTTTQTQTRTGEFECLASNERGFVRRHPANPFRLVFEDGTLYPAIGIGDCFRDSDNSGSPFNDWGFDGDFRPGGEGWGWTTDTDTYMRAYGNAGFNLFRWSVDNCAFKLWEKIDPAGNSYLERELAWGDTLVTALRRYGFRIYMVIFGFEPPFPTATDDSTKMNAVKRYVRYVVARYGAYVDFWELMNEYPYPIIQAINDDWYTIVAGYLRSVDPYDHLISTNWPRPDLEVIDVNSLHWYQKEKELDSDEVTVKKIQHEKDRYAKPVIFSEQGNQVQNWDEKSALRMRIRSWTAFFNEGMFIFWNTSFAKDYRNLLAANIYLGPEERSCIRNLQNFTQTIDADVQLAPATISDPTRVRAYGLRSSRMFAAYLHNFSNHDTPTTGLSLTMDVPHSGLATWYEPATGNVLAVSSVSAGRQTLSIPAFTVDLALIINGTLTSVEQPATESNTPVEFSLSQNYPNPFNPSTTIRFSLPQREHVTLKVFDVLGREVATLVDGEMAAGNHAVTFAPRTSTSGLYFYKITAGTFSQTRKAVLMK
jgi:hypothetical protein